MAIEVCVHIPSAPPLKRLTLPGTVLEDIDLLGKIQSALAPLMPIFQVIDAVVAVYQCVQAIQDAIKSLSVDKMVSCIPELAEKVSKLLRLVPQLSIPLMVVDLLDICISVLGEARGRLTHLEAQMADAQRAIERGEALNDPKLLKIGHCAQENIGIEAANTLKGLTGLGNILGLVGVFLNMIGGPKIPSFSNPADQPIDEAVSVLDELVDALQAVRRLIPIP
jgi:hypothetical protein